MKVPINIAKCGCDCLNCPTYKDNIRTLDNRRKCSFGWEKYLQIKLSPEKLRACDGCSITDANRKVFYLNCKIRKCAIINEIPNCAFCKGFPCDELIKVHSVQQITSRDAFVKASGKEISEEDYRSFIEPYAGLYRLNILRKEVSPGNYKEFKKFSLKTKFAPYSGKPEQTELKKIYLLLTTIGIERGVSYARWLTIQRNREQIMKILWAVGCYGTFDTDTSWIELDSRTFMSQKLQGMYKTLLEYCKDLKKSDTHCEIIPLVEKGWLTPMGGLRKEGWIFRLKFGDSFNGTSSLKAYQDYIQKLFAKYGNNAFKVFNRADMRILIH